MSELSSSLFHSLVVYSPSEGAFYYSLIIPLIFSFFIAKSIFTSLFRRIGIRKLFSGIDPSKEDIVARCREECDNKGVNIAFDAAGVQVAMDNAVKAIRARGTLVNIAIWEKPANIYTNDFNFRERHYVGVATYMDGDFEEVLQALSDGRLDMCKKMITKRIKLNEVLEEGFKTLINDRDNHVKILVESSGET